ncbi:MAG: hypothetical protein C5B58_16410 [Acidobacteria bacterium]|nr:MAG: hypothetical protein C5B58_16410 [Acidobacteriota bacterium]
MFHIDDLIKPVSGTDPARSRLSYRSLGRVANPPLHHLERQRIMGCDSGESSKSICKEMALQGLDLLERLRTSPFNGF